MSTLGPDPVDRLGLGENALHNLAFLAAFAVPLGALRGELRRR